MFWFIYILAFLIGLFQTPLLVDLLKVFFPEWRVKRLTNKAASLLLAVLMTTFFMIGLAMQVFIFIPLMPHVPQRSVKLLCHCIFAYWVWINMVINYYYAVFTNPGFGGSPSSVLQSDSDISLKKNNDQIVDGVATSELRKPADHNQIKEEHVAFQRERNITEKHTSIRDPVAPSRHQQNVVISKVEHGSAWVIKQSHYCKVCQNVVLYMDHHCPFTANCVGLRNYSYFFLCLVYASVGLGYSLVVILVYFGECLYPTLWQQLGLAYLSEDRGAVCSELEPYLELFYPVVGGFVVETSFVMIHVFLLLSNITTYDVIKNFWTVPVFRYGWQRIRSGRCFNKDSRLNVLLLTQRSHLLWFLLPAWNINPLDKVNISPITSRQ